MTPVCRTSAAPFAARRAPSQRRAPQLARTRPSWPGRRGRITTRHCRRHRARALGTRGETVRCSTTPCAWADCEPRPCVCRGARSQTHPSYLARIARLAALCGVHVCARGGCITVPQPPFFAVGSTRHSDVGSLAAGPSGGRGGGARRRRLAVQSLLEPPAATRCCDPEGRYAVHRAMRTGTCTATTCLLPMECLDRSKIEEDGSPRRNHRVTAQQTPRLTEMSKLAGGLR